MFAFCELLFYKLVAGNDCHNVQIPGRCILFDGLLWHSFFLHCFPDLFLGSVTERGSYLCGCLADRTHVFIKNISFIHVGRVIILVDNFLSLVGDKIRMVVKSSLVLYAVFLYGSFVKGSAEDPQD